MTETRSDTNSETGVGDKVQVRRSGSTVSGIVVEDFVESLIASESLGRDWAAPHRWAVALEDGTLVFVDDEDLTTDEVTHQQ